MKITTSRSPSSDANGAGLDGVSTQPRTNRAFLQNLQRRRQGAGAEQQREILRLLHRELTGDDTRSPDDGLIDAGALMTLLSSTMASCRPTFAVVTSPN